MTRCLWAIFIPSIRRNGASIGVFIWQFFLRFLLIRKDVLYLGLTLCETLIMVNV